MDRILMFITNNCSIKEVLAYPKIREEAKKNVAAANSLPEVLVRKQKRLAVLRAQVEQLESELAALTVEPPSLRLPD
jgi:aspartyl-tRNA synthetase